MKTKHGLSERQLDIIRRILAPYAKQITQVNLFGSRASGNYRPNSDLDMVIHGAIDQKSINALWTLFHESARPFSVDVKSYTLTDYAPLKEHMDQVALKLFSQKDLLERNSGLKQISRR